MDESRGFFIPLKVSNKVPYFVHHCCRSSIRSLNGLFDDERYIGYGMPKLSPQTNHLAYADNTILFGSGD